MSSYFYHPLGNYAENYLNGTANYSQMPHTREDHGWSKMDFGVGGGLPVYSMSNGIVINCGYLGEKDGVSKYGVIIKTSDCGYSRMMAKLKGGNSEDYPLYFTYIEMDELSEGLENGMNITKGTQIGVTNDDYSGSNLHFDIQPYDRYSMDNAGNAAQWAGCITMTRYDAYGDKGAQYNLKDHLDSSFSLDSNGNLKDSEGRYLGVNSNNIFYPPSSSGQAVLKNTNIPNDVNENVLNELGQNDMAIKNWYSFSILTQMPIKIENNNSNVSMLTEGWYPSNDTNSTGIEGYFSNGIYTFPVFKQGRGPWANEPFWDNVYSDNACSITAAATIASGILGRLITPPDIATAYMKITGSSNTVGFSYSNNLGPLIEYYGGKSLGTGLTNQQILDYLSQGKPVEINLSKYSTWGNGYTTKNGHLIALLSYNKTKDQVFLADPAHPSGWFDWKPFTSARASYSEAFN